MCSRRSVRKATPDPRGSNGSLRLDQASTCWSVPTTRKSVIRGAWSALTRRRGGTYVRSMHRASQLPETRLTALYDAHDFGGEKTMRAKVIRELIDEIRLLRRELDVTG